MTVLSAVALSSLPAYAQGFPGGEPPPAFSVLQAVAHNENQGIKDQLAAAINFPLYLGSEWMIFSGIQAQNINLANHPMNQVPHYNFSAVQLSLNARSNSENGDGWIIGLNAGSASDEIFSSSDVLTYSLQLQRKNKWSDTTAIYYGFVYSNNNALLPGLPIPTFAYEYQSLDKEDLYRIGVPTIIRLKNILPQTTLSAFAIGPVIWDLRIIQKSLQPAIFSVGFSKRPETFLISHPASTDRKPCVIRVIDVGCMRELGA